jgi:hypothetical protein
MIEMAYAYRNNVINESCILRFHQEAKKDDTARKHKNNYREKERECNGFTDSG